MPTRRVRLAIVLLLPVMFLMLQACDSPYQVPVVVAYVVSGFGDFPAQEATFIEFTASEGATSRLENVSLPRTITTHHDARSVVSLEVQVQAPMNQSGLEIIIRADGQVLDSSSTPGADGTNIVTRTLGMTRTLP